MHTFTYVLMHSTTKQYMSDPAYRNGWTRSIKQARMFRSLEAAKYIARHMEIPPAVYQVTLVAECS